MSEVKPIPDGYHTFTAYLALPDAGKAIDFYKQAFGAIELCRMPSPEGRIGHAELKIGDSVIMLADEVREMGYRSPRALGGSAVSLLLYVEDVDSVFNKAIETGGTVQRPIANQFYGDRSGALEDPFGHLWIIATHVEDVPPEEMAKRAKAFFEKRSQS